LQDVREYDVAANTSPPTHPVTKTDGPKTKPEQRRVQLEKNLNQRQTKGKRCSDRIAVRTFRRAVNKNVAKDKILQRVVKALQAIRSRQDQSSNNKSHVSSEQRAAQGAGRRYVLEQRCWCTRSIAAVHNPRCAVGCSLEKISDCRWCGPLCELADESTR